MDEENQQNGASSLDLNVKLPGFIRPEVAVDNRQEAKKVKVDTDDAITRILYGEDEGPTVKVRDARTVQNAPLSEESAASFFRENGFCLFPHQTKVKDWNENFIKGIIFGSDISSVYSPELENIIRNYLLSEYKVIAVECPPAVLRRGPNSKNNFYGTGVHQDYGLTAEDFKANLDTYDPSGYSVKNFQEMFDREDIHGMMMINFWRPIEGYTPSKPLTTKPLAVCEPSSVNTNDTVHTCLDASKFGGKKDSETDQMALKNNSDHKWFYYPNMIDDEVLVFKQLEVWKDDPLDQREAMPVRGCFHTAFIDPNTPGDAPPRISTECRVKVFLGKRKDGDWSSEEKWTPPAPLWPKTGKEWGMLCADLGSIGMIFAAVWSQCPAIPSHLSFIFAFAVVGAVMGLIKFSYSLKREGNDKLHPGANSFASMLGLAQLAVGIWGMVLVFPNVEYLTDPSPETCELGPMIAMLIPAVIIACVLVGIVGFGIYSTLSAKKEAETVDE